MLNLKKYANGQFFDSVNKRYIKVEVLKDLIAKGEEIKVTVAQTGKDITKSVIDQFAKESGESKIDKNKKESSKKTGKASKAAFLNTDSLKKWAGTFIDTRITQVLETIKLPTRKQIKDLDTSIKALNKKIDKLELLQVENTKTSKAKSVKKPVAKKSATAKPEVKKPEVKKPEVKKPEVKKPVDVKPVDVKPSEDKSKKTTIDNTKSETDPK